MVEARAPVTSVSSPYLCWTGSRCSCYCRGSHGAARLASLLLRMASNTATTTTSKSSRLARLAAHVLEPSSSSGGSTSAAPEPPRGLGWASRDRQRFASLTDDGRGAMAGLEELPSPFAEPDAPVPLSEEQLWSWCSAGFHVIAPETLGLPRALHELLYAKLKFALHEEYQPGNNIQARVPELSHILSSPAVAGAVETLLGPGALQYPHMYCHNLEPEGSEQTSRSFNIASTGTCHQDAFSPLGRPRHHNPWHCYVCYYPQDTCAKKTPPRVSTRHP
jgi:hypothetical protein